MREGEHPKRNPASDERHNNGKDRDAHGPPRVELPCYDAKRRNARHVEGDDETEHEYLNRRHHGAENKRSRRDGKHFYGHLLSEHPVDKADCREGGESQDSDRDRRHRRLDELTKAGQLEPSEHDASYDEQGYGDVKKLPHSQPRLLKDR